MKLSLFLVTACAVVMCFMPLMGLLGYESAVAMALVIGPITLMSTVRQFERGDLEAVLALGRRHSPLSDFLSMWVRHSVLLLPPVVVLCLNAVRVPNCDLSMGLWFFIVIVGGASLVCQCLGWVCSALPRWRLGVAVTIIFAEVGLFLWRLAWQPPITGHEWLIGYFSGSIYDEGLSLPSSLLWYRMMLVTGCGCVVLGLEWIWRGRTGRGGMGVVLGGGLVLALTTGWIYAHGFELGIKVDRDDAVEALGGHIQTAHFNIHYDETALDQEAADLLARDHEYIYDRHAQLFELDIVTWRGEKIRSYVYPNRDVQKRLLGSRNTLVARPWTHEMHIRWTQTDDGVLAHEMAHLFTAEFAHGPLQLAMRGRFFIDIGLVEGIAHAADWPADVLPGHEASAAMRRLELAPDLRSLFNVSGFWNQPGPSAYTLMGSFVRYLIDKHGISAFKKAYGGGDFQTAYGRSVDELISEWEAYVDGLVLTQAQMQLARFRYSRQTIFEKVCARTIGDLSIQARTATWRGEHEQAMLTWEQIVNFEPGSVDHRIQWVGAVMDAGRYADAMTMVSELNELEMAPSMAARVDELEGDLLWRSGNHSSANTVYDGCRRVGLPEALSRRLEAKWLATSQPTPSEYETRYLLDGNNRAQALYFAMSWAEELGDRKQLQRDDLLGLSEYLTGLQLYAMGEWSEAVKWLDTGSMSVTSLDGQRRLLLARALRVSGDLSAAEEVYRSLLNVSSSRLSMMAADGVARTEWERSHPTGDNLR